MKPKTLDEIIQLIIEYKEKFGTVCIPSDYKTDDGYRLGNSTKFIAYSMNLYPYYNKNYIVSFKLNENQYNLLYKIGFKSIDNSKWDCGYMHLIKYYNKFGNINVSTNYKTDDRYNLGEWCRSQRRKYKNNKLNTYKINKLLEIGFRFDSKRLRLSEEEIKELIPFLINEYGNLSNIGRKDVIKYDNKDINIGRVLNNIRCGHRHITDELRQILEENGLWDK